MITDQGDSLLLPRDQAQDMQLALADRDEEIDYDILDHPFEGVKPDFSTMTTEKGHLLGMKIDKQKIQEEHSLSGFETGEAIGPQMPSVAMDTSNDASLYYSNSETRQKEKLPSRRQEAGLTAVCGVRSPEIQQPPVRVYPGNVLKDPVV